MRIMPNGSVARGVSSPLELAFLQLFERHDIALGKQVPVSPVDRGRAISTVDFAVPEKRLAVYIDGASFHCGAVLRRDRAIRERLRQGDPGRSLAYQTAAHPSA